MTDPFAELDDLTARLRDAAARLRDDELSTDDAAALVDECARLAAEAGAELDRQARAGDGLYAEAFHHLLHAQEGPPERVLAAARELAAATGVGGMVGGQYLDIAEAGDSGPAELRRRHELKTGRLIEASVECALLLAGTPQPATIALRAFAAELGVLFQIVDDILDVTGTDADLGKSRGSDERLGRLTYVSAFGLDEARSLAAESHAKARAALDSARDLRSAELHQIADFIHTRPS